MKVTPAPWQARHGEIGIISDDDSDQCYGMFVPIGLLYGDNSNENAERIVECVNACEWMEYPEKQIKNLLNSSAMHGGDIAKIIQYESKMSDMIKGILFSISCLSGLKSRLNHHECIANCKPSEDELITEISGIINILRKMV